MKTYAVLLEKGPRNWSASVPDLPGCIATGRTRRDVLREIASAIEFHVEGLKLGGDEVPAPRTQATTVRAAA